MNLLELRNKLTLDNQLDNSSLEYYQSNCDILKKDDLEIIGIKIYGYEGTTTKQMTLNKESLIALIDLMIRQGVK